MTTITETKSGTISEFLKSRERPHNPEQAEAFAAELNAMLVQLVFDSNFSEASRQSFPKLMTETNIFLAICWLRSVHDWFSELTAREEAMLTTAIVQWS